MAVAMVKMRKQHSHLQQEAKAAEAIQARMRGKLARRFALRVAEKRQEREAGRR